MPIARGGSGAVLGPDGRIYVLGGVTASGETDAMHAYDIETNTWSSEPTMLRQRSNFSSVIGADGKLYVLGGSEFPEYQFHPAAQKADVYDFAKRTWSTLPDLPEPRLGASGAALPDGRILVIGGFNTVRTANWPLPVKTVLAFTPSTGQWSTLPETLRTARAFAGSAVGPDGRIVLVGGYVGGTNSHTATAESRNPATGIWSSMPSIPESRDTLFVAFDATQRLFAFGGMAWSSIHREVYVLGTNSKKWERHPLDLPYDIGGMSGASTRGFIFMFGGWASTSGNILAPVTAIGYAFSP